MITHVNNCCTTKPPPIGIGKIRPACGREELPGCTDVEKNGLQNSILDKVWSKPLWYHALFNAFRTNGTQKPQNKQEYKTLAGVSFEFHVTDHYCSYDKTSCDTVFRPNQTNLLQSYNPQFFQSDLTTKIISGSIPFGAPCVYPNCWINEAETNKAKCDNKYYKLIAHYPSVGRPFQGPGSLKAQGLRNSNISPDIAPGRQILNSPFQINTSTPENPVITQRDFPVPVEGSHDKADHFNTAYPGKYWISWWNGIHPGNIIGYEGIDDTTLFKNPLGDGVQQQQKLSEQIKCWDDDTGSNGGACEGFTFIQQFETTAKNTVLKLSSGWRHSCILTADYKCFCWGEGYTGINGQANVPQKYRNGSVPVKDINCGGEYTVVTLFNGTVDAWGKDAGVVNNIPAELKTPTSGVVLKKISTGGKHVVALMQSDVEIDALRNKKISKKNSLRIWGDNTYKQCVIPKRYITSDTYKINYFLYGKDDRTIGTRPVSRDGTLRLDYSLYFLKNKQIIPWWPILKFQPTSDSTDGYRDAFDDERYNYYHYSTVATPNGVLDLINEYESSIDPDTGDYYDPISENIEFEDVWAGKYHTIALTKSVESTHTKIYNPKFEQLLIDEGRDSICRYSPKLEMDDVIPTKILKSHLLGFGDAGITCSETGQEGRLQNKINVWDTVQDTNIVVWGSGMALMDDTTDKKASTSSNFDYKYYARNDRISRTGQSFPNILTDALNNYQIKTNASSYHTIILGKRKFGWGPDRLGSYYWQTTGYNAWGWGDDTYSYLWSYTPSVATSTNLYPMRKSSCGSVGCNSPILYNTDYFDKCTFLFEMFVIDPNNINFTLNLFKETPEKFFQFAYYTDKCKLPCAWGDNVTTSCNSFDAQPNLIINLGTGYTAALENDTNETSIDYNPTAPLNTYNNIMIRTGESKTYLIKKIKNLWIGSTPTEREVKCFGSRCNDGFKQLLSSSSDINFFEAGISHQSFIQIEKPENLNGALNFPYNVPGESKPFDTTSLLNWTQNGLNVPRIQNFKRTYKNFKNDTWHQPIFDKETSSRIYVNLNITLEKIDKNGNQLGVLDLKTDGSQSFMLVGTRGDQRVKPFTGATGDCMWSDWATDPLKVGGHSGVILNETTTKNHDENQTTIPWDNFSSVPDRKYVIDPEGIQKINYYSAPPNVLTHNIIEVPPGKFPSQLSLPCRQKFCEGGINSVIKNWCDPCFGYGLTLSETREIGKTIWPGRLGCTGCEINFNKDNCQGCTFKEGNWICPPSAPNIRDVYGYLDPKTALGATYNIENKTNSFGELATPIEEAWPSLNRYFIPRWATVTEDTGGTQWVLDSTNFSELTSIDYPLVVVPAHGGDIGVKYDLEAYQEIALSASLGSLEEYVNRSARSTAKIKSDSGIRYIIDFKDSEYPFYRNFGIYPDYYPPNGFYPPGVTYFDKTSKFYPPPPGVTFIEQYFTGFDEVIGPACGNSETGCSSCAIPFTGAEVASWGFDLYSTKISQAISGFLGLSGDPIQDPEIGNINAGGVWMGVATDRFVEGSGSDDIKKRVRVMLPITLKEGETLKFGNEVTINNTSTTVFNTGVKVKVTVKGTISQYPNNKSTIKDGQKYSNYEYRWGRFNDECGCYSRVSIEPDIFLLEDSVATPTIQKLKAGRITELTNKEKASIIIGGRETLGLGLVQYWNCINPVTYLESGEGPLLDVNGIKIGLCDLDNRKPTFLYETQNYFGDGAKVTTNPVNNVRFYRGEYNIGFVFCGYRPDQLDPTQPNYNDPIWQGMNSSGIRGLWSGWLNGKGWANFFTSDLSQVDSTKDRMGGDIPFESSHPQGWLGFGSAHPHIKINTDINSSDSTSSSLSVSSMSDLVTSLRDYNFLSGQFSGLTSRRTGIYDTSCDQKNDKGSGNVPYYNCSSGAEYSTNNGRRRNFDEYYFTSKAIKAEIENEINVGIYPQNPKTQKLKMCCFGNGYEHEVYSTVTRSYVPDTYSKVVKSNKYRNLYNALWHSYPLNLPYISFRKWHGDPYQPNYCQPGSNNCKSKGISPVWFDYWYPSVLDSTSGAGGVRGFNYFKNIANWRHQRWDLPIFIGVNRDNVGNFYIHDPNCENINESPESCSGMEIVDFSFDGPLGFKRVGWDHRNYDSISAQSKLSPDSLYFYKTNRGAITSSGDAEFSRGAGKASNYKKTATFYTVNGDVWRNSVYELCLDSGFQYDLYNGLFGDWWNVNGSYCLRGDNSKWNEYYMNMGPGYVYPTSDSPRNKFKAYFTSVPWF